MDISQDDFDEVVKAVSFAMVNAEPFSMEEVQRVATAYLKKELPIPPVEDEPFDEETYCRILSRGTGDVYMHRSNYRILRSRGYKLARSK